MSNLINDREMGTVPISIATSLAFDGLYNRHPDLKKSPKLPAARANVIYINARTLIRNIMGATSSESEKIISIKPSVYADALLKEMDEIKAFLAQEEHPLTPYFYFPTYKSLAKYMGNGELKELRSEFQKAKNEIENQTLQFVFNLYKDVEVKPFIEVDMDIPVETYQKIFILTHLPVDLLNVKNASEVLLVESHTGRVKEQSQWYTKLNTEKDSSIPFNKGTLLFFGDSGGMFKAQPFKSRKRMLEVASKRKWNAHTTKDRMLLGLELEQEPFLLKTLKALFR